MIETEVEHYIDNNQFLNNINHNTIRHYNVKSFKVKWDNLSDSYMHVFVDNTDVKKYEKQKTVNQ